MITDYINAALATAVFEQLEDGSHYGEIRALPGVWADGKSLEECRHTLQEVLEDWLVLALKAGDAVPEIGGIDINRVGQGVG